MPYFKIEKIWKEVRAFYRDFENWDFTRGCLLSSGNTGNWTNDFLGISVVLFVYRRVRYLLFQLLSFLYKGFTINLYTLSIFTARRIIPDTAVILLFEKKSTFMQ